MSGIITKAENVSIKGLTVLLRRIAGSLAVAWVGAVLSVAPAQAIELPGIETKLVSPDPLPISGWESQFGNAVALEDRWLVVGAPQDDVDAGLDMAGAVFVFERVGNQWVARQRLTAPTPASEEFFGFDVGITLGPGSLDDFLIVGAPGADAAGFLGAGKAFIFRLDNGTWVFDQELQHASQSNWDAFGTSVDIDGSIPVNSTTNDWFYTAVVGAPENEEQGSFGQGSIHIFQYIGGPPAFHESVEYYGAYDVELGTSVAIADELIVAGAPKYEVSGGNNDGGAGLFSRGNDVQPGFHWAWGGWLEIEDPSTAFLAGRSVDLEWGPPFAAVGCEFDDQKGAVFIYEVSSPGLNRTEIFKIENPESTGSFGTSVAMDGTLLAVGDPGFFDSSANLQGAVYLYQFDGVNYIFRGRLHGSDLNFGELGYGWAMDLDDGVAAVGSPNRGGAPFDAVYLRDMTGTIFHDGFESGNTSAWSTTIP